MTLFYNLSTRAKLLSGFLFVILINVGILITSMNTIMYNINAAERIDDILNNAFSRITTAQKNVDVATGAILRGLNRNDQTYTADDLKNDISKLLADVESSVAVIRPEYFGRQDYAEYCNAIINNAREAIKNMEASVMPLVNRGNIDDALRTYLVVVHPKLTAARAAAANVVQIQTKVCLDITKPASDRTPIYVNSILALLGTLSALVMAFFIAGYISKAVLNQITILERMADGDFSFHIDDGHNDEFGHTYKALRRMRISISDIVLRTKDECVKLQSEMRHLQQLSSFIVNHSASVESQALTVSAASDEMVSTTQDIARNCETAAQSSLVCKEISDNGLGQVMESIQSIREQSEHTKDNAQKIESLAQQTKEIGSIVSTIDDIAAQTNLLALNAAIEAARAGEAGRGFAVVADEVRALASRTTTSTQEISKMVKHIQDEAALATDSINASVVNMESVAEQSSKTEALLKDITHHVIEVHQQITQIATAAEEQTTATGEIAVNMQNITNATSDMTENANDQNKAMDSAYVELEQLMQALSFFKTRDKIQGS